MDFKTKWYSPENKPLEIPTFQDLQNVTGQAFDDFGNYVGKKEMPKQQLVIDKLTQRQYYAPEEYSEDAIRYGKAKIDESFKPKDWYGMTQIKPNYKFMEHISAGYISTLKSLIKPIAELPTKIVYTGAVGLNAISRGNFQSAETLYRSSMKNWEQTLDKAGLGADPELQDMLTVKIGSIAGQTASSLLIAAAVSSVGGLPAVAAVFGSQQFADVMEEGLAKGLSHKKAVSVAFQAAVAEGGLEAVGFRLWSGAASMNKSFRNIALGFLWEGAQEGSQQIAESAITNFYGIREQDLYEIMAEVALSALVGGLVGGVGAGLSGQVEQRNIALKKEIGMTEQGNIATPKTKEGKTIKPSKEAEKQFTDQEIAEAKRTGDNKLYNIIKNIANAHGITDEKIIDKIYPVCRKMVSDGATLSNLQDIIGQQVVAYKNQLDNNQIDKEANDKAVEQIKLVTDPNRVEEWREGKKSELEKAGVSKRDARIATKNFARTISNLSQRLGFDITKKYDVSFEKRAPMSETLKGIKEREEGDTSFNFGANSEEEVLIPFQEGLKTQAELLEAKRSIEQGLRAQKSAPRSTLLSLLRRVGANYSAANRIDKEAYKNAGIRNKKSGIGDELAFFLRDNGFMSFDDPQTYEDKSRLEDEAADLIDRALSGEKIYSIENQALADEVAMAEESREQAEQELRNINIDLTRGQISFLGKVAKIALGETFDFTTLEHEFFHFIDRVVLDAAKEGNVEAQKLVKKRNNIIQKAKADLKKRGIKDMPIDEEILASAYEKWLWQGGKSEDAYEQRLFNAIREFFREVYDTVKGLMGIRITPEADAYFRAMTGESTRTLYQFAGPMAETADRLQLSKAEQMLSEGKDAEEIRKETGWFKGVDGKWRFEISDERAATSPESTQDIKNADAIVVFDDGSELSYTTTESPNIYYQSDKDLFATHNMNLAGAKQALKLGGLAMPSMAIRRTSTENTIGFGEVSFVANERLAAPKRGTEVYDRDAWTPSIWNNIRYRLNKSARNKIENILKKTGEENKASMYFYTIEENLYDATRNELALDLFLKENNLPESARGEKYDSPDYIKWYNENLMDDATPYLYTENDDNTDMVNRKLTLGNIMKVLRKKERAAGGYIGEHIFSVEELIKFFPQRFRNIKQVRAKKENLMDFEDIRKKIDDLDNDFSELVSSLRTEGKEKEYGSDRYAVGLAIINPNDKAYQKDRLEDAGLKSDDETIAKIDKFAERLKNEIPVEYFEVKPRRVVDFGEFSGVIMPDTKEYDSLAEQLKTEYGLPVMRIEKGNVSQYKKALNTIQNMYPTTFFQTTQEELFRNDQALKEGAKVLDKAPTNEQVEKELATIRSGRVVESEPKRGFGLAESIGDFVLTVRQRVGTIDKRLKYAFDKLDFNEKMYESKYGKNVVGYIKKYRKLDDTKKRELDYLILNKQDERIREFVRQNDMLEEYNQARTLLDNLYAEGNKAGMDMGFLQEYFPTKVVDPEGLITYLKGTDKWTEIERALAEIDPNNQMSIEDRANAINNILRGYNRADPISKQGFQNERLIFHKTPEMMKFYAPSDEALMRYVSGMSSALAIRNAFNVKNAFNAEESIGGVVQELIKSGQITYKEEAFIRKMLKARLNYARTAPIVALLKNFGYLGTMNNITSAVTQIGDLYANFYKYNFGTAMKALFGKREITKEDLHIDSIWEEFADAGWTGIAVNKLFSAIGLNKFDKFGKETAINGAWIDLKERLKNNDISLLEDLSAAFGSRSKQVMEDIKNNNITEDVKLLIWTQLADTQPLGKSGVPVGYLNNPHGRIIYQLKTYTINQLSLFYADGIYKINKGLATKNKKLFLQGVGNTAKLALLLTIFNAGADALKNLIMGRKIDISDTLLSNMLWNIGVTKYTFYRGQRDGYARALLENYLLPPQISMGDDAYMDIKKIATGKRKPSDTIAVTYVPFGRMWYWWFGGGRTQEKKKGNKPFEVEL